MPAKYAKGREWVILRSFKVCVIAVRQPPKSPFSKGEGLDDIKGDLEAINVLLSRSHNPRVMVIIGESVAGEKLKIYEGLSITETAIIDQFLSKNFKVIDAGMVKKTIEHDQLLYALEGDNALAVKIGLQYNAEIVIMGKATADPSENIMETSIKSIHTNMSAKAIRSDNGEIIATESASCTKAHVNESIGAHKAFQESGKKLADALMKIGNVMIEVTGVTQNKIDAKIKE